MISEMCIDRDSDTVLQHVRVFAEGKSTVLVNTCVSTAETVGTLAVNGGVPVPLNAGGPGAELGSEIAVDVPVNADGITTVTLAASSGHWGVCGVSQKTNEREHARTKKKKRLPRTTAIKTEILHVESD